MLANNSFISQNNSSLSKQTSKSCYLISSDLLCPLARKKKPQKAVDCSWSACVSFDQLCLFKLAVSSLFSTTFIRTLFWASVFVRGSCLMCCILLCAFCHQTADNKYSDWLILWGSWDGGFFVKQNVQFFLSCWFVFFFFFSHNKLCQTKFFLSSLHSFCPLNSAIQDAVFALVK